MPRFDQSGHVALMRFSNNTACPDWAGDLAALVEAQEVWPAVTQILGCD